MGLSFERTKDFALIRQIATHPKIYPFISDDFSPTADKWKPNESDSIWYVLAQDDEGLLGMWTFIPENYICWKVHTCLLPNAYGEKAKRAAKAMAQWIWDNTICLRIITDVPATNRLAYHFALAAGMTSFGINHKSYMKNGVLQDQILLGMSK